VEDGGSREGPAIALVCGLLGGRAGAEEASAETADSPVFFFSRLMTGSHEHLVLAFRHLAQGALGFKMSAGSHTIFFAVQATQGCGA